MKSTGIVRPVDPLGRVVLPKELRETLGIGVKDGLEIFTDENTIILRKYVPGCTFCGGMGELKPFGGHNVCGKCRDAIRRNLNE